MHPFLTSYSLGGTSQAQAPRILVVEDEDDLSKVLQLSLRELPAQVKVANMGSEGLKLALTEPWDVVVLDLNLPELDGTSICRKLRESGVRTPIIMLTARTSELDRVMGLEFGADDYVTKPFSLLELQARVKVQLRRSIFAAKQSDSVAPAFAEQARVVRFGRLRLDVVAHSAELNDKPLDLTPKEWELLRFLAEHPKQVFSRIQLLEEVWGEHYSGYEHTLNSHINRLRGKLGEPLSVGCFIRTVWGLGYSLEELSSG